MGAGICCCGFGVECFDVDSLIEVNFISMSSVQNEIMKYNTSSAFLNEEIYKL